MNEHPIFFLESRPDGYIHLILGPHDAFRTPFGVLLYVLFAPFLRLIPQRGVAAYLAVTSLVLALTTMGPNYTALIIASTLFGLLVTRSAERAVFSFKLPPDKVVAAGVIALALPYGLLLARPQPAILPPVAEPVYFYLQWAGFGYLLLRAIHVLVDRCKPSPDLRTVITTLDASSYFAYMLFAPTLRMGPLYSYNGFLSQLHTAKTNQNAFNLGAGLIRLFAGFVRLGLMMLLSDPHLLPVTSLESDPNRLYPVFNIAPHSLPYWQVLLGTYLQPMRIFLWMSGYVDLAIGTGLLCGFTVPENFNYPWVASSIRTFWRRWHIPLGAWLRDYVFIPLGGSRRWVLRNYFVTFLFCGLWHGLYPSYIAWGISQGIGLGVNRYWRAYWDRKRDQNAPIYRRLRRIGLADRPLGVFLAWLFTFHYQILTIGWGMDDEFAGRRFIPALFGLQPWS